MLPVARQAGELGRTHRRSHPELGVAELLIVATALVTDAQLATANIRHYPMLKGLRSPYRG